MGLFFSNTVIAAMMVALLPLSAIAQPLSDDKVIVPGTRIGAAELAPADQGALFRELGEPNRTEREGGHEYYMYGTEVEPDALIVDFDLVKDEPFEISTTSSAYHTQDGLRVGSAEQTVRAHLGQPICAARNAEGSGVMIYDKVWFLTSNGAVTRIAIRDHLSPDEFRTGPVHC